MFWCLQEVGIDNMVFLSVLFNASVSHCLSVQSVYVKTLVETIMKSADYVWWNTHTHRNHLCPHCLSHQCGHSWVSAVLASDTLGSCNELYLEAWVITFRNLNGSEINPRGLWTGLQRYFLEGLAERGRPSCKSKGQWWAAGRRSEGKADTFAFLPLHLTSHSLWC